MSFLLKDFIIDFYELYKWTILIWKLINYFFFINMGSSYSVPEDVKNMTADHSKEFQGRVTILYDNIKWILYTLAVVAIAWLKKWRTRYLVSTRIRLIQAKNARRKNLKWMSSKKMEINPVFTQWMMAALEKKKRRPWWRKFKISLRKLNDFWND